MIINTEQIVMVTTSQLQDFAERVVQETIASIRKDPTQFVAKPQPEYRYGLRGIRELFGVSHATAQHYKNTFLKPAIEQRGRKILVNVELARKLYNESHNA